MGILEHVKVLEAKVDKEIDFAKRLIEENNQLKEAVNSYMNRIVDLESIIQAFKEEQSAVESGILSALNRLNQFEDTIEKKLAGASLGIEPQAAAPEETAPPDTAADEGQPAENTEAAPDYRVDDVEVDLDQVFEGVDASDKSGVEDEGLKEAPDAEEAVVEPASVVKE